MEPVCEIDQWGLWAEAECRGDEFRIEGVDEVDQAGAPERAWRDAATNSPTPGSGTPSTTCSASS
ncbi:hypothetical protein Apa02nite_043820 [Actinoplanes palleronii]|uniref:Uncharacterized protein n=1 Tax=Actinoplanes palleronii TaxID=113570 RepID=A0ABQ4BC60_9ACTN|nr:hypothetical protein Apa02nite_043820 [Actinoplanes palleronii]